MLHTKYQGSRPSRLREFFLCFNYTRQCNTCAPRMGSFWQHGHNLIKPDRGVYFLILNTKYKSSMPRGPRQEDFYVLWKTSGSGVEPLLALGP